MMVGIVNGTRCDEVSTYRRGADEMRDQLRMMTRAVEFVDGFIATGKPLAAICHAPWLLIETNWIKGKTITSWPSLKSDLINAGAHWVDREVVVDNGLVTSRKPADIPAFNKKVIQVFAEARPRRRGAASMSGHQRAA